MSLQLGPMLCNPMDCTLPGSSVREIHQARILEWIAMPSSGASSKSRDQTWSLMFTPLAGRFFTISATWEALGEITICIYYVCVCVCVIYFKESAHEIDEVGNRVGGQLRQGLMYYFFFQFY